jgi:hypothetical protein
MRGENFIDPNGSASPFAVIGFSLSERVLPADRLVACLLKWQRAGRTGMTPVKRIGWML